MVDLVDVIGDTAYVSGSGVISSDDESPTNVLYQLIIDESDRSVQLTVWAADANPDSTTPIYRLTGLLPKRRAIKVDS
mgnify:CR=1 FL=1